MARKTESYPRRRLTKSRRFERFLLRVILALSAARARGDFTRRAARHLRARAHRRGTKFHDEENPPPAPP